MDRYLIHGGTTLNGTVEISGAKTYIRIVSAEAGELEDERFNEDFPDPLAFIAELQQRGRS